MTQEVLKLALEALMRSRNAVSGDLDLAGCAYGKNDPDGHRYSNAKEALVTLDKAITAIKEALAQPEQDVAALVTGMEVSIDVSTGEHDSGHRLFGVVDLVQENQGSKHGLILLVQEPKANFKEALAQPEHWGASAVGHPAYVAAQKRRTEELRSRLTQPEQEPVAIVTGDAWETDIRFLPEGMALPPDTKLYTTPPQRTWVGLTEDEVDDIANSILTDDPVLWWRKLSQAIEARLKELNT